MCGGKGGCPLDKIVTYDYIIIMEDGHGVGRPVFRMGREEMNDVHFAPVCGIYCGGCEYLGAMCAGCGRVAGKPFWASQVPGGVCPLHDCCANQKGIEHCGLCADFPCGTFLSLRDPSMSDEQFQESLERRQSALRRRAKIGTEAWLQEVSRA
jgi:hypothetical protein